MIDEGRAADLDLEDLKEFLGSMAGRQRQAVERKLALWIESILKWEYHPGERTRSRRRTIGMQRRDLIKRLRSGSLRRHAEQSLEGCYCDGAILAADATGLAPEGFPADCPWTLDELMAWEPGER